MLRSLLQASIRTLHELTRENSGACAVILPLCHLTHSRPQRPRSFWSAPRIATSGLVQRHSVFEWLSKHNRLRPEPIRFVKLDSEHAQSDGKSVNRGLPVLDLARGRDSWCWPKGARPLGTRMHLTLPWSRTWERGVSRRDENLSTSIPLWRTFVLFSCRTKVNLHNDYLYA